MITLTGGLNVLTKKQVKKAIDIFGKDEIEEILKEHRNPIYTTMYGEADGIEVPSEIDELLSMINYLKRLYNVVRKRLEVLETEIETETEKRLHALEAETEKRLHALENIIKPDEVDVHNINRRIEKLAYRVAELESEKRQSKKWWRFRKFGGG